MERISMLYKDMTLLDYFAGQALTGYISKGSCGTADEIAEACYTIAHEMLKVRVRENYQLTALYYYG